MFETILASVLALNLNPVGWAELLKLNTELGTLAALVASLLAVGVGTALVSNARQGVNFFTCDVIGTATTGDSVTVAHGLGAIDAVAGSPFAALGPQSFQITPRTAIGRTSSWIIGAVNTTSVVLTKLSVASSASSAVQATLFVERPMSLAR